MLLLVGLTRVDPLTLWKTFNIQGPCLPPDRVGKYVPAQCPMTVDDMGGTCSDELKHQLFWLDAVVDSIKRLRPAAPQAQEPYVAKSLVFREPLVAIKPADGLGSTSTDFNEPKLLYALVFVSRVESEVKRMDSAFARNANIDATPEFIEKVFGTRNVFSPLP